MYHRQLFYSSRHRSRTHSLMSYWANYAKYPGAQPRHRWCLALGRCIDHQKYGHQMGQWYGFLTTLVRECLRTNLFIGFYEFSWGPELPVGKEFLLRLPDLFDLPHVKIDTSALLVYYNVLLQGLFMDRGLGQRRKDYASYMYRKLLEHAKDWDFEAQPTPTDLYAALLLVRCAVIMNRNIYSTDSNPVKDFCNKLVFR